MWGNFQWCPCRRCWDKPSSDSRRRKVSAVPADWLLRCWYQERDCQQGESPGSSLCWPSPQQTCSGEWCLFLLKSVTPSFVFFNTEAKVTGSAPRCKLLKLHSVCWLVMYADLSQHCWAISKLGDVVAAKSGSAVMCEQAEKQGASKVLKKRVLFNSSKPLMAVYFLFIINTYF